MASPAARTVRDEELKKLIREVHDANYRVYGARKIWRELGRQGRQVARCTVERLMRDLGITGAVRGRKAITTMAGPGSGRTGRPPALPTPTRSTRPSRRCPPPASDPGRNAGVRLWRRARHGAG